MKKSFPKYIFVMVYCRYNIEIYDTFEIYTRSKYHNS